MTGSSSENKGRIPRFLVRALARFYYPRLEITRRDRIPSTGPVLLVANHPNSMLDPPLLGITANRPIHFLAKAPLFRIPLFGGILRTLGMLPAYRACDDPTQMKRNAASLEEAARCLAAGRVVGIFPEGKSHDLPRVDQVKTGAARIAAQAWELGVKNLVIVPVGLNYQRKEQFRTAVWIRVGAPIAMTTWMAAASAEERARVRALTQEIDRRLKMVSIHLDEPAWALFLDELEHLYPLTDLARVPPSLAALRHRKRIAEAMNYFLRRDRAKAEAAAEAIGRYIQAVRKHGLRVDSPVLRSSGWRVIGLLLARTWWVVFGFALALPGTIFHLIPFAISRGLAAMMQTKLRATFALARLGASLPVYAIWYGLAGWLWWGTLSPGQLVLLLGVMPFLGVLALRYWYFARRTFPPMMREWRMLLYPAQVRDLKAQRDALPLERLAEEFTQAASTAAVDS